MGNTNKARLLVAYLISCLLILSAQGQNNGSRIGITAITPSINTGQDYSPWLNDNMNDLVADHWAPINQQYIDVTLTLTSRTNITRVSLYDYQGVFMNRPATIYALNGTQRILLGTFTGQTYMNWVDMVASTPIAADAIVIHKYGNNIPVKLKIFGNPISVAPTQVQSVISFGSLAARTVGAAPFDLVASSNNTATPITFTSSNSSVVSVSNSSGRWQATVGTAGTATITASQAGNSAYLAAANVSQSLTVQAPAPTQVQSVINFPAISNKAVGTAPFDLVASSNNTATPITFTSSNSSVVSVSNSSGRWQATVGGAGTATITASQAGNSSYLAAANVTQSLTVQALAPTQVQSVINFPAISNKTAGTAAFDLVASSNNTATPITFVSSNPAVVTVSNSGGRWQALVGTPGTATITASQAGNTAYLAAANVNQSVTVQAVPSSTPIAGKIPLDGTRWYQITNSPDDLRALTDGITSANVPNGYGRVIGTFDSFYPLKPGETFRIESIRLFDGWGQNPSAPMTISVITDTWQRVHVGSFNGVNDQQWIGPYPNRPTTFTLDNAITNARYIVLTSSWAYPTEMELYGSYTLPTPSATPVPTAAALAQQRQVELRQACGVNAFEWDVIDGANPLVVDPARVAAIKNFNGIRHYLDWDKLESVQGDYTFNPSHMGSWNYDAMYTSLKTEGVEVLACLKTMPGWMLRTYPAGEQDAEHVPVRYGADFAAPASYREQAQLAFQFAARYGRNQAVDRSLLRVSQAPPRWTNDPVNQVKVGLDLITYIECDNERDKWWKGRLGYQTAFEYAANLSAFYDGHKNTMGAGVGVKNADPTMQVVMGGLASPNPDYVKGMVEWCRQYRGLKPDGTVNLCWDVINYHHYANDAGSSQGGNPTRGSAPEVSDAGERAAAFLRVAHESCADMPVWLTESGYDHNQGSVLKAIAVGSRTVAQTQADWLLRSALSYARWGVERVFHYQAYDDNPTSSIQFGSMGLLNNDRTPRLAAQYLQQAQALLGRYRYQQTLNADPLVDRYALNGQNAYMLVVPDERGRTASYTLQVGAVAYADVYRPQDGSTRMSVQRMNVTNGQIQLNVTETPLFVLPAGTAPTIAGPTVTACSATGTILREQWSNVDGWAVSDIPLKTTPTSTSQLTQLESNANIGSSYGARIRGYVCAPQTGAYTFWVSGDDNCEVWLSTDDNPDNKVKIASVQGYGAWTNAREWYKYPSQQSAPVNLVANGRYYIEVLHKEDAGGDVVSVGWRMPNGVMEGPIPGSRLSPYVEGTNRSAATPATVSPTTSTTLATTAAGVGKTAELSAAPNPFSQDSYVRFKMAAAGNATVTVYDMQGRQVRQLFSGSLKASQVQEVQFKAESLPAGIYTIRLTTDTEIVHQRVVLTK